MEKMRLKLGVLLILVIFLGGCAGMQLTSEPAQKIGDIGASMAGYVAGKNNLDQIPKWIGWIDDILALEAGASVVSYKELLAIGFNEVSDDPFLKMQFGKIMGLLEFPKLQPPDLPFLTSDYVKAIKIVMGGLKDGLVAAQAAKVSMLRQELEMASREAARETDFDLEKFSKDLDDIIERAAKRTDEILKDELMVIQAAAK